MLSNLGPLGCQAPGFQGPETIQKQFQAAWVKLLAWSTLKGNIL